jgi:hypothetical protein
MVYLNMNSPKRVIIKIMIHLNHIILNFIASRTFIVNTFESKKMDPTSLF